MHPLFLLISPQPEPTVSPVPDVGQVSDFSAAISGLVGSALLFIAGLAWVKARRWLGQIIEDVNVTKVQTTNSHDTNMRDDITAIATAVKGLSTSMSETNATICKLDSRQTEMHQDIRETRRDLRFTTEYVRDVDKRLIAHEGGEHKKTGGSNE